MTIDAINAEIDKRTNSKYGSWHIGVTNNPDRQRDDCERSGERTDFWLDWRCDSADDAKDIETRYINRGMKHIQTGQLSGRGDAYVFIF
jgi:hypothetical protein